MSVMHAILFKSQKKCLGDSPVERMLDDHAQISEFNPPAQIKLSWCCIPASSALVGQRQEGQQYNIILGFTVSSRQLGLYVKQCMKNKVSRRNIFSKITVSILRDT